MTKKILKPTDFTKKDQPHYLELDPVPAQTFAEYLARHILLLRHAYTLAQGQAVTSTALSDGQIERLYIPRDDENNRQYYERIHEIATLFKPTRVFTHVIAPVVRIRGGEIAELTSMIWYAEDSTTGDVAMGSMDPEEVEGFHFILLDDQRADPKAFAGFPADEFRSILH